MKRYETDGKSFYLHKDNCPTRCPTWSSKAQDLGQFNFSESELIWDDSHDTFMVQECQTCGSHYLWHWHEEIDWDNGNDSASTCARSLRSADLIAMRYFLGTQPSHPEFKRFLEALMQDSVNAGEATLKSAQIELEDLWRSGYLERDTLFVF